MSDKVEDNKKASVDFDTAVKDFEQWLQKHDGITVRRYEEPALRRSVENPGSNMDRGEAAHTPKIDYKMKDDDSLNGVEFKNLRFTREFNDLGFSGFNVTREFSDDIKTVVKMTDKEELQVLLSDSGHYKARSDVENDTISIEALVETFKGNLQKVDQDPKSFTQSEINTAVADTFEGFSR